MLKWSLLQKKNHSFMQDIFYLSYIWYLSWLHWQSNQKCWHFSNANSKTCGVLLSILGGCVESCRSIGGILRCPCRRWVILGSYNFCCGWKKQYQQQTLCTPEDHQNHPVRRKHFNWSVYIKCLIQYIYQKETRWHWTEYIPDRILCLCHIHLHR